MANISAPAKPDEVKQPERPKLLQIMGPGLITGASDDDPSGIATYSQAGAQYGFDLAWVMVFSLPLMCAIQEISARIGRVTGRGLAGNLSRHYPKPLLWTLVSLLVAANTINLGADLGAMAAALKLLVGGPVLAFVAAFAVVTATLEVFLRYSRYVSVLKWLTLSLFAYVGVAFVVHIPWSTVGRDLVVPNIRFKADYLTVVVAILGTTISPYLFFWQAAQEMEDLRAVAARTGRAELLPHAEDVARSHLRRIRWDTYLGMGFSNLIAFFIILSTAATLHAAGIVNIQSSGQAAEALRPIGGAATFLLFSLGIIGTGMLAIPVLAGSAAYAVAESFEWRSGLDMKLHEAREFYGIIAVATIGGVVLNFTHLDPMRALIWSAEINGVIAVPIMVIMMLLASREDIMGRFVVRPRLRRLGWAATTVMAVTVVGMFATQ